MFLLGFLWIEIRELFARPTEHANHCAAHGGHAFGAWVDTGVGRSYRTCSRCNCRQYD